MTKKQHKIMKMVKDDILAMSCDRFMAEIERHRSGDIAKILIETKALKIDKKGRLK